MDHPEIGRFNILVENCKSVKMVCDAVIHIRIKTNRFLKFVT